MERHEIDTDVLRDSFVEQIVPVPTVLLDRVGGAAAGGDVPFDLAQLGLNALQGSRQAICLTDARVDLPGPVISYVNDPYTDIFCCDAVDAIGQTPRIGQGPLTNRRVLDRLRAHLAAGESVQAQAINYRLDRTVFRLRWSIDPIHSGGALVGFIAFMRDVTVEDRLRRRLAALDTLVDRGRVASTLARAARDEAVSSALSAALRPIVAEIGSASVRVGQVSTATQIDEGVLDGTDVLREEFAIGTSGVVSVDLHPDADDLFDRLAVSELAEHARWLLELGEPS